MPPARRLQPPPRRKGARAPRFGTLVPLGRPSGPELDARLLAEARSRAGWVLRGFALGLTALALRASWVMALPDQRLEERGREQFRTAELRQGRRGAIFDRNGRVLATTVDLPTLFANPSKVTDAQLEERVGRIVAATGATEAWVRSRFAPRPDGRKAQEVELGDGLDPSEARAIVAGLPRDAMWLQEEPVRVYPAKEEAAPLVGFVDNMGDGAAGIEKVLDRELAGDTYRVLVAHDRKGRAIEAGVDQGRLARAGHSVRLTMDAAIQHAAERALYDAVVASRPEAAMAVVMDVETGAVLAIASLPAGNPNDGASRAKQELFKNRPAMDQAEPGSVIKPFVAAAALEEGLVTASSLVDCELGSWTVGGRTIRDDHPKGVIAVTDVIKFSSNIGAAKLAFMVGAEKTLAYLKDFGFGRSTGLQLPGEVPGALRGAATIRPIELATTAFGQGMTASPIQLAAAVGALANGGMRMSPYLVDAVLDRNGEVETLREPRIDRRVVSEDTARIVSAMMETVIDEGGTGTRAKVKGYRVAGKTGTAQKVENGVYSATKRVSSFVGFLPADRPEIAVAVVVDTPTVGSRYGGIVAAPVFARIGEFTMRYLGIQPDPDPVHAVAEAADGVAPDAHAADGAVAAVAPAKAEPPEPPAPTPVEIASDGAGGWILPDLKGRTLRDALAGLGPAGVALRVDGFGRLVEQSPPPGARVAPGDPVHLRFD